MLKRYFGFCYIYIQCYLYSHEKKPKLDLLRTCVAAVPKLMPANDLSVSELVEMLLRFTVHMDEELRALVELYYPYAIFERYFLIHW